MSTDKAATVGVIVGRIASLFLAAWVVMLLIGACHHDVSHGVPAFGYWATLLVIVTLRVCVSLVTSAARR